MGYVDDASPADVARLRDGVPVSIEAADVGPAAPSETRPGGDAWLASRDHWRGQLRDGWNLVGVALSDSPAAPGSGLRAAPPAASLPALYFARNAETGRLTRWTDCDWQQRHSAIRPRDHRPTHLTEVAG